VRDEAQNATATQVEAMKPTLVAVLGDEQYQNGYHSDFENSFDKYWGAFKFLQRPSPGNHEFYDNHGQTGVRGLGYFDYYNGIQHSSNGSEIDDSVTNPTNGHVVSQPAPQPEGQAGQSGQTGQTGNGWYSYDLGAWHLISLNVECADEPGGCSPTGTWFASETKWLAQDLNADHAACTLAYWHQPAFSSTATPFTSDSVEGQAADTWWKLLYAHHADQYYGVMKLVLHPHGYSWDYESALESPTAPAGTPPSYSDTGSGGGHSW
jgi:hypothetical protein